jgi:hypothetical protein
MLRFYGLLHIDEKEEAGPNIRVDSFEHLIKSYTNNAVTLSRTLEYQGLSFTLLTNRMDLITDINAGLSVKEIDFQRRVPRGVPFYSAHHKIDVFRYLSTKVDDYSVLCDLDMVCINPIPQALINIVELEIPLCYEVTDQVIPAYGRERVLNDIELINESKSEGRWYGGEFIGGNSTFFKELYDTIDIVTESYIRNMEKLHHIGDEAIVSPAIELIRKKTIISEAGCIGLVSRFWNCNVQHPQKPFEWSKECFMIHLPGDKELLAKASQWRDRDLKTFKCIYEQIYLFNGRTRKKALSICRSAIRKIAIFIRDVAW